MLGRVLNTHQQWLGRKLADLGWPVARQVAVPDTGPEIQNAVREALTRSDLVVVTGGLGPTSDDITRDLISQLLGRELVLDPTVLADIEAFFAARNRPMAKNNRVQAMVPRGATVLRNPVGTAPGLAMELRPNPFRTQASVSWVVMLPGPPRELRPMFQETVVPLLNREFPSEPFICHTLRTDGLGESALAETVGPALEELVHQGLELGYCARPGEVDVRLAARGVRAAGIVSAAERIVREKLGASIYAEDDQAELEHVLIRLLTERKATLALAESCTGGLIAHQLTNVPGASKVLLAGVVSYSNEAKQSFLGVKAETLAAHGAVSEPVAREMAEGVRARTGADYAISVTGIAGPDGGTPQKPVGTVFIGLAAAAGTAVTKRLNVWDRQTFKQVTCQQALEMLRLTILRPA